MLQVFGIRHHGPGSARSLRESLVNFQPDILLVEGPPDADALIPQIANSKLIPPVALLIYDPKDLGRAAYFPFADFSPEWQAIQWALKQDIPVRFIDLPQTMHFGLNKAEAENKQLSLATPEGPAESPAERLLRRDPMAYAAQESGYRDSERWWEAMFENPENPIEIFPAIVELIAAMRANVASLPPREQMREAYMREMIRKARKEGFERIAVVCGAWHSAMLDQIDQIPVKQDKAILRGIKKVKTKATWVPWTYDRLSQASGYGAGVISPAYYQLLFHNREELLSRWMTKVARLFRKEDFDASSAHVIEAIRLAETLATMRGLSVAGLEEMYEAAVSIFCEGYPERMAIIENQLIIGNQMGKVPPEIPVIPLQQNLEKTIKSARLSKFWQSTERAEKKLDLRTPTNLLASHLLHRLDLLGIPWGTLQKNSRFNTGNFTENWKLKWQPDFAIRIIEAGMWGNTVHSACNQFLKHQAKTIQDLPQLTGLIESALNADLEPAVATLVDRLKELAALTRDVQNLLTALPALVNAMRYGSTRKLKIGALAQVIDKMIPRICLALPVASTAIDEEASKELFEKLLEANEAINLLSNAHYLQQWYEALEKLSELPQVNSILRGACIRMLFDKERLDTESTATRMYFALSQADEATEAALWLEGFLHGSGLLLVHNPVLWNILDGWMEQLTLLAFQDILPLLRRTFSGFSRPEREKMMALARRGQIETEQATASLIDEGRAAKVLPTVKLLLGLK